MENKNDLLGASKKIDKDQAETEEINRLLKMAQDKNPTERVQGISGLLAAGQPDNPVIKHTLEKALSDQNAEVRAQAISSLAHREGEHAAAALQTALQDSSVDVRVMAVDSAGDNIGILQQALHDSEDAVRSLAALKLEILNKGGK